MPNTPTTSDELRRALATTDDRTTQKTLIADYGPLSHMDARTALSDISDLWELLHLAGEMEITGPEPDGRLDLATLVGPEMIVKTPALQEVYIAFDVLFGDMYSHYTDLDDNYSCTVRPDQSRFETVDDQLTLAVDRWATVTNRLNGLETMDIEIPDLGQHAEHVADTVSAALETGDTVTLPVHDILLVCGVGTDLELTNIEDAFPPEGSSDNPIRGVCAYAGMFTTLTERFVQETGDDQTWAEYTATRGRYRWLPEALDGARVTLSTAPPYESRGWGS